MKSSRINRLFFEGKIARLRVVVSFLSSSLDDFSFLYMFDRSSRNQNFEVEPCLLSVFFGYASSVKFDSFSTFVTSNSSSIYFNFIIRNFFLHSWILEDRCETRLGNVKKEKENLIAVEKYRTCEHSIIASLGEKRFPNCMTFVTRFQFSALAFRNNFHFSNFTVIFVLEPCHD